MGNRDFYKDEFGNFQEVEEETEDSTDGYGDDEQDFTDEEDDDLFDSAEEARDSDYYDEDEDYANDDSRVEYDIDED